ncbi:MAG TPA: efflux RND transporter periplasmic adaptor subunit, partial [Pirellulales bacterium]
LKLKFAEANDRWVQDVANNTHKMIALMSEKASLEEIEKALKESPMGNFREKLMSAYIGYHKAQATMDRLKPLSEQGVVPARQMLEAEAELDATRASLQSLLEQISQDALQSSRMSAQSLKELQTSISVSETALKILGFCDGDLSDIDPARQGEKLAHYPVAAPFDGTVISKDVVLLERVAPDRQILTIADLSTVWVSADIYETHLPLLAQLNQQTVSIRSDAWPEKRFEAVIFYTGDVVQESTRTIALRAVAQNAEGLLKPGMFVTVELPGLNTQSVLQTGAAAVQEHESNTFVFVQTGEHEFERCDVVVGRRNADFVEIRSGLQPGDKVVVKGGFALKSQMLSSLLEE